MTGYTKLFGSIVASTIWREPHTVRIVWITMLAMANKDGIVEASLPGLADLARVTIPECTEALQHLEAPDEYSRTPDFEGRRITNADGGWKLLNHAKYRAKMGVDERREYLRLKKQESRTKVKESTVVNNVNKCPKPSTRSTQAEAKEKTEAKAKTAEDVLDELRQLPAYVGIDFDREFGRMKDWLSEHPTRSLSRGFMVNWIGKAERALPTRKVEPKKVGVYIDPGHI